MKIFTTNSLKILACICMVIDHIGFFLFPNLIFLRVIGRIAFPIFAYLIAKGCIYTRNKLKRFLSILILGLICEPLLILLGSPGNILLTFSLSILLIYLYMSIIKSYKDRNMTIFVKLILFFALLIGVYYIDYFYPLDYRFMGIITPLIIIVFSLEIYDVKNKQLMVYRRYFDILSLFLSLTLVIYSMNYILQVASYLSLGVIFLYNHQKGKYNLKYLFYGFYPLHLLVIYIFTLI